MCLIAPRFAFTAAATPRRCGRREPIDRYAERLIGEIDQVVAVVLLGRRRVTHLHWGGGTPFNI